MKQLFSISTALLITSISFAANATDQKYSVFKFYNNATVDVIEDPLYRSNLSAKVVYLGVGVKKSGEPRYTIIEAFFAKSISGETLFGESVALDYKVGGKWGQGIQFGKGWATGYVGGSMGKTSFSTLEKSGFALMYGIEAGYDFMPNMGIVADMTYDAHYTGFSFGANYKF